MIRRILVVQTLPRPGVASPNNALLVLARHLDRRRYEFTVAVPRRGLLTEALAAENVRVLQVPGLRTYRRHDAVWRLPVVALRVAACLRRTGAHLVLANHAELGPFAHAAARLCSLPWISFLRQAERPLRYYEKYRVARADAVGAVSHAALEGYRIFLQRTGAPANPMRIVPPGIGLPPLEGAGGPPPLPAHWLPTDRIVGTVGLREVKQPERLVEAVARLASQDRRIRCLLLGEIDSPRREGLESLARNLGIGDRIYLAGQQDGLTPWYRAMHVYAHTSRSEGFGKVILEAMSHGLPVVAFRTGGLPEAVVDGETGYLCEPRDSEGFASRLALLLGSEERARALGREGREVVANRFSPRGMAVKMAELFDIALAGKRPRTRNPSAPSRREGEDSVPPPVSSGGEP